MTRLVKPQSDTGKVKADSHTAPPNQTEARPNILTSNADPLTSTVSVSPERKSPWASVAELTSRKKPIRHYDYDRYNRPSLDKSNKTDDAPINILLSLVQQDIGLLQSAELVIGQASPEDRALLAGMALPELKDISSAILAARKEFAVRRAEFSKQPLPTLSAAQVAAIKRRANNRPWSGRQDDSRDPFEWVRDNYEEFVGQGLLQAHLKADPELYEAFAKSAKRLGLPDWLDVPNEKDAFIRSLVDPTKQFQAIVSRHLHAAITKIVRTFAP